MSKFFALTVILAIASIASVGVLGVNFDMITQALGAFSFEDSTIELLGCDCFDKDGNSIDCNDANVVVTDDPLCPQQPSSTP